MWVLYPPKMDEVGRCGCARLQKPGSDSQCQPCSSEHKGAGQMPGIIEQEERQMLRAWFVNIDDKEGMQEALCFLRKFLEDGILEQRTTRIEVFIRNRYRE